MFLLSSSSAAIKILEFLLEKTLWKYFDKNNSKHQIETIANGQKILLISNLHLKRNADFGMFKFIFIEE